MRFLVVFLAFFAVTASASAAPVLPSQTLFSANWSYCGAYETWQEAYDAWLVAGKPRQADIDNDGIPCEALPGAPSVPPASTPAPPAEEPSEEPTAPEDEDAPATDKQKQCKKPKTTVKLSFSKTKYPNIKAHTERAIAKGQPKVLKLNRKGADERRKKLLKGIPTKPGYDRDEYAPAVGRATWKADVEYVPSSENRSHGSSMGIKLRPYCDGTKFMYTWY